MSELGNLNSLPLRESLGVLLGVLGLDWLITGSADIYLAIALAAASGALMIVLRRWQQRRKLR